MPPASSTAATRDRILSAARAEFARYGIAGARIDRIAKAAKTSKERVYAYFTSKEALYRLVSGQELAAMVEATQMDPADLPGYAGRLHDYYVTHPEQYRLLQWGRLELDPDEAAPEDPIRATMAGKLERLRRAQTEGILDPSWDPIDILVLLNQMTASWAAYTDFDPADPAERDRFLSARRTAVVTAVQRLFPAKART
ncbi:TetR family transcriptional regulator [Glycomyces sp. NPDC021274]|uniref:TetR family transcriptional regulator n=1 Tax=Glycomyces sp. NPDC021274 TaxID=3155120 RepID=UPI0033D43D30